MATASNDHFATYGREAMHPAAEAVDFVAIASDVAGRLFGPPNNRLSSKTELRFGTNGSMSIDLEAGAYYDHEAKAGGGILALIQRERNCDAAGAFAWLEDEGLKDREWKPAQARSAQILPIYYEYRDETGAVISKVRRSPDKRFIQMGPDGSGGFHAAKGCMDGVRRVPYRLPELIASDPGRAVFLVEGEKDTDRLSSLGLIATCNPQGAGKFGADLVPHFDGRQCVIIADNDEAGRNHAEDVASKLIGTAAVVTILELPGLPPKGDVSDWLDAGGTVERLKELARAALDNPRVTARASNEPEMFPLVDLRQWSAFEPSPKAFLMPGYVPAREMTLVTGEGGANKSTFGQQLATCVAAHVPMLGLDVSEGVALYITAEDDDDRLHWMQAHICKALGVDMADLAGKLQLSSLRGRLGNELATFDGEGRLKPSPAFHTLKATIRQTKASLVVLDNCAHLFAGNENDRGQVTAFVNLLYSLCVELSTTIILVAHTNKAGDDYSGSTAWLNAVRSQVRLSRTDENDPDARALKLGKANYARQGEELRFRWHDFALVLDSDLSAEHRASIEATTRAASDNALFLACLTERNKQQRAVSEKRGPTYAPTEFAKMAEAKGLSKQRLEAAMDRLFRIENIERAELWKGSDRKPVYGLRETAGNGAVNTVRETRETVAKSLGNGAGNAGTTHTNTTYYAGAASGARAPASETYRTGNPALGLVEEDPAVEAFDRGEGHL
jgi:RecA-family ATPase